MGFLGEFRDRAETPCTAVEAEGLVGFGLDLLGDAERQIALSNKGR
jgi:hypothetical protein